jgi:hypothetical protein
MSKFGTMKNKGFHITFNNGLTISVQFGAGNYCSNKEESYNFSMNQDAVDSSTAEIAIWNDSGKWFAFNQDEKDDEFYYPDTVKGWVTPDEVGKIINKVRKAKSIEKLKL